MLTEQPSGVAPVRAEGRPALSTCRPAAATGDDSVRRCEEVLQRAGLRPTAKRRMLIQLLFANGDRHVTADDLFAAAAETGVKMSSATVYNTLNQFTELGLLRQIGVGRARSFFDTNTSVHPHFFFEGEGVLSDIPEPELMLDNPPEPLPGYAIERIDVIVHLRRKREP